MADRTPSITIKPHRARHFIGLIERMTELLHCIAVKAFGNALGKTLRKKDLKIKLIGGKKTEEKVTHHAEENTNLAGVKNWEKTSFPPTINSDAIASEERDIIPRWEAMAKMEAYSRVLDAKFKLMTNE